MKTFLSAFFHWLPLAAAITALAGTVYVAVQQSYRMNANDPQIQMANDAAQALAAGNTADAILPNLVGQKIDIASSLAPYWAVYDEDGVVLDSDASLGSGSPMLPEGVFEYTRGHGEDRITWQPEPGVRSAVVLVHIDGGPGGFVLAGRSLREVERRVAQLTILVGLGWVAALTASLALTIILEFLLRRRADPV